jgi:hypothetical protein
MPTLAEAVWITPSRRRGARHGGDDPVGEGQRPGPIDVRQKDAELVPTETGKEVLGAQLAAQSSRADLAQQLVASLVTEKVVDGPEPVEVDHDQGQALVRRPAGERPPDPLVEVPPVG